MITLLSIEPRQRKRILSQRWEERYRRITGVDFRRETSCNVGEEKEATIQNPNRLKEIQRAIHDEFVAAALNASCGMYSLHAPGG